MKPSKNDRLLNEVLGGEDVSEFRQASLEQGLFEIRRRRRARRVVRLVAMAGLPLVVLLALGIVDFVPRSRSVEVASLGMRGPGETSVQRVETSRLTIISDEELLALFPGRARALIGPPGDQRLLLGD